MLSNDLSLYKMRRDGFGEKILKCFKEYLADRTYVTNYGDVSSTQKPIHSVLQGIVPTFSFFI